MGFLLSLLGTFLGILFAVGIIVAIIIFKIKRTVGTVAFGEIASAMRNAKDLEKQEYGRPKSISGMTKLLEEPIQRDFPDFNKDVLFGLVEKNLKKIFTALEDKSEEEIKKDDDLILIYPKISEEIKDMKNNGTELKYDNVVFHAHAIKKYQKKNGMATISTSSGVEYFYSSNLKHDKSFDDIKKQTRYTCEFAYIYDEAKVGYNKKYFGIHCPNCGAPLNKLGAGNCRYCGSYVENVNLKSWKMTSYKEDC